MHRFGCFGFVGCSFLWDVSTGSWSKGCKQMDVWGRLLLCTWPPFWNIWLLRCWSWRGMLAKIWRWRGSHQGTCNLLSGEMKNLIPSSKGPLLVVVLSLTFTSPWSTKLPKNENQMPLCFSYYVFLYVYVVVSVVGLLYCLWTDVNVIV